MAGRIEPAQPGRAAGAPDAGAQDAGALTVFIDGQPFTAYEGDTVAAVLYAIGRRAWRQARSGQPRGLLCGMGICFDCLVGIDDTPALRACQTLVRDGMRIVTSYTGSEEA